MQKQEELKYTTYEKVFQALYWLAKEEISNTKITAFGKGRCKATFLKQIINTYSGSRNGFPKEKNPTSLNKRKNKKNSSILLTKKYSRSFTGWQKRKLQTQRLQLLEKAGVSEIKYFQTRLEPVLREMLIILSSTIVEGLTKRIINSKYFGLLTDEVTNISNVQQLVTFIKFFVMEKGDTSTVFVDSSDLLEQSEEGSQMHENAILNCLVKMLDRLGLDLSHLKAFSSDGASVMTGAEGGVAAKCREINDCKTMINVHCICHGLALACSGTGDELQIVKDFELTMIRLCKFFKDSPKRIKLYFRVAMQSKNFDAMSKRQKRKVVLRVNKACRTRWLSLHTSVNAVFEEYVGLLHLLRILKEDKNAGSTATGILKKMENFRFLGTLYLTKFMLPHPSILSKTFQTGSFKISQELLRV